MDALRRCSRSSDSIEKKSKSSLSEGGETGDRSGKIKMGLIGLYSSILKGNGREWSSKLEVETENADPGTEVDAGNVDAGTDVETENVEAGTEVNAGNVDAGTDVETESVEAKVDVGTEIVDGGTNVGTTNLDVGTESVEAGTDEETGYVEAGTEVGVENEVNAGRDWTGVEWKDNTGAEDKLVARDLNIERPAGTLIADAKVDAENVDAGTDEETESVETGTDEETGYVEAGTEVGVENEVNAERDWTGVEWDWTRVEWDWTGVEWKDNTEAEDKLVARDLNIERPAGTLIADADAGMIVGELNEAEFGWGVWFKAGKIQERSSLHTTKVPWYFKALISHGVSIFIFTNRDARSILKKKNFGKSLGKTSWI